jgi:Alpha-L-arabinofuranosidase B (ABFB) domain
MKCAITAAVLGCMLVTSAVAEPPVIAEIRLNADPTKCLSGQQGKAAEMSSTHARKFKFLPGLTDSSLVSLEVVGFTRYYVRYHKSVFFLHLRPRQIDAGFDSDATFKMVPVEGDKVRFESKAYPNCFMTAWDDGAVVLLKNPPLEKSTFVLKKD